MQSQRHFGRQFGLGVLGGFRGGGLGFQGLGFRATPELVYKLSKSCNCVRSCKGFIYRVTIVDQAWGFGLF